MNRITACLGDPSLGLVGLILVTVLIFTSTGDLDTSASATHCQACRGGLPCAGDPPSSGPGLFDGEEPRADGPVIAEGPPAPAAGLEEMPALAALGIRPSPVPAPLMPAHRLLIVD